MIGQTISHYKILEKLGEGGMGVVYKAQDLKLDRFVALKFLPPHVAASTDDKARFLQEAKAVASLAHPNICTIYSVEEEDGKAFIVMEYVEGKTLKDLEQNIPLKQAIEIGIQIADGLAAAHGKGIVHRDIKPDNIMLRKDGRVQIMDFGLAKLKGVSRLTKEGSTVGTAGYMSPEQVQGQDVDERTDLFSLGVVLYELVAGQSPFKGVHETAITYEIVNVDPQPISQLREGIDPRLDAIILECLEKDKSERRQSAKELAKDLKRILKSTDKKVQVPVSATRTGQGQLSVPVGSVATEGAPKKFGRRMILPVVSAAGVLTTVVFAYLYLSRPVPETGPIQFSIPPPEGTTIVPESPAISPDERTIAFTALDSAGRLFIWLRSLGSMTSTRLAGTEGAAFPFWSPDGKFLGFFAEQKMKKLNLSTGMVQALCDGSFAFGAAWGSDNVILLMVSSFGSLCKVPSDGGTPVEVTALDKSQGEERHYFPQFLSDGRRFIYSAFSRTSGHSAFYVASLENRSRTKIMNFVEEFSNKIIALPPDDFFYRNKNSLMLQRFDPTTWKPLSQPIPIVSNVSQFAVSSRVIVTSSGATKPLLSTLVLRDRQGRQLQVEKSLGLLVELSVSPDENRVAYHSVFRLGDEQSFNQDIWVLDRRRGITSRITYEAAADVAPVWSPDGNEVVYASSPDSVYDLYLKSVSSSSEPQLLLRTGDPKIPLDWSSDGKYILYLSRVHLWVLPMFGDRKAFQYLHTPTEQSDGAFSPDGRSVAYTSDESGRNEVYLQDFPTATQKSQVSKNGGKFPHWRRDGKELFYCSGDGKLTSVDIRKSRNVVVGDSRALFEINQDHFVNMYAVVANGDRFLVNEVAPHYGPEPITVLVNWKSIVLGQ